MGDKKSKKKCCGKFEKKGKHCSSCPLTGSSGSCKDDKEYCKGCDARKSNKKGKKDGKKKGKKKKK